jgi:ribosomal protein S18 acetylase RimI-like enzyme
MAATGTEDVRIRPVDELDISAIVRIDEKVTGRYRPEDWERRIAYYLRRDPESSFVAESGGQVVGFMLGEVRAGEFGLEEPTGWVEVLGVDPSARKLGLGRKLAEAMIAYFRKKGAKTVRTLVDTRMAEIGKFFESVGLAPSAIRVYEKPLS